VTILHYRAELVRVDGDVLEYRYFPDHVMAPDVSGVFRVNPSDWSWTNSAPARAEERGLVSMDAHCIQALIFKLRKVFTEGAPPPEKLLFIA
jgi:hypothetical protein